MRLSQHSAAAAAATLAVLASSASAQIYKGFNYGSVYTDGTTPIQESAYEAQFKAAQNLVGTSGFTAARLYTMIQAGSTNAPTEAIQAAINTKTKLLLGMWASAGEANIQNELAALSAAMQKYQSAFTDLIIGISVGSEDLYRISPTGIINKSGVGAEPEQIAQYIREVKKAVVGTGAAGKPIGHVDTYTAWINGSNEAVVAASDFIGMDAYPYFQNTMANGIENGPELFQSAYDQTVQHAEGKPVWVTETGWPISGKTENLAVPNLANAKTYWDKVGCDKLFNKVTTFWYTLQDAYPSTPNPSFGIVPAGSGPNTISTTPLYDLSCPNVPASSSSPSTVAVKPASKAGSSTAATSVAGPKVDNHAAVLPNDKATAPAPAPATTAAPAPVNNAAGPQEMTIYTTLTTCPATEVHGGVTKTFMTTTTAVVTSCPGGCAEITHTSILPAATASGCPTTLSAGSFEYPHLIVPVDKSAPSTAKGTSYNGTVSPTVSSIFNFDIPASDAGKTCSLVFFLPTQSQLTTSAFSLSGTGGLKFAELAGPATEQTTYDSVPAVSHDFGGPDSVTPGNEYMIASFACPAASRIGVKATATDSLSLDYFQDYNPSPIGLYITVC